MKVFYKYLEWKGIYVSSPLYTELFFPPTLNHTSKARVVPDTDFAGYRISGDKINLIFR